MRITKDAEERKQEILYAAEMLFNSKGYDETTITDIIEKVGVARGTIYYHFKSKEEILNALVIARGEEFLAAAKQVASDKSIPVPQRLFQALLAMNGDKDGESEVTRQMHKPQNALMHQKSHEAMLKGIPPILVEIIHDGIEEGLFHTPYPYESLEMVIAHVNTVFNDYLEQFTQEELLNRIKAFSFNLERLFGAEEGSFNWVIELFITKGGDEFDEEKQ